MFIRRILMVSLSLALFTASAGAVPIVFAVSVNYNDFTGQFGTMDLSSGSFHPIGPETADPLGGLIAEPGGKLISVSFAGNLDSVNPATGAVSLIGATGLGDLAGVTAELNGTVYVTDLNNNIYTLNTTTGLASLIGATGLPICPSLISPTQVSDETLFAANGKLYATFDGVDLMTSAIIDPPELYQINPVTGVATVVSSTTFGITATLQLNGTVYALDTGINGLSTVTALNLTNGNTTFLNNYDSSPVPDGQNAITILGIAQAPEPVSFALAGIGIAALLVRRRRGHTAK